MERGALPAAQSIAEEVLQLCRSIREVRDGTPQALRDLSIALDNVGSIARELGHLYGDAGCLPGKPRCLPAASACTRRHAAGAPRPLRLAQQCRKCRGRATWGIWQQREGLRESLDIARQLRHALGDTPQALRDLSISLNNVGSVERDLGDLAAAREAYRESLDIGRATLRHALGDMPQALRDLSVSLDKAGNVEHDLGDLGRGAGGLSREPRYRPAASPRAWRHAAGAARPLRLARQRRKRRVRPGRSRRRAGGLSREPRHPPGSFGMRSATRRRRSATSPSRSRRPETSSMTSAIWPRLGRPITRRASLSTGSFATRWATCRRRSATSPSRSTRPETRRARPG